MYMDDYIVPFSQYLVAYYEDLLDDENWEDICRSLTKNNCNELFSIVFNKIWANFAIVGFIFYYFKQFGVEIKLDWLAESNDDFLFIGTTDKDYIYKNQISITKEHYLPNSKVKSFYFYGLPCNELELVEGMTQVTIANCNLLKEITLPKSIKRLSSNTLENCENLKKIVFQGKLYTCSGTPFANCPNLKLVVLPKDFNLKHVVKFFTDSDINPKKSVTIQYLGTKKDWPEEILDTLKYFGIIQKIECINGIIQL